MFGDGRVGGPESLLLIVRKRGDFRTLFSRGRRLRLPLAALVAVRYTRRRMSPDPRFRGVAMRCHHQRSRMIFYLAALVCLTGSEARADLNFAATRADLGEIR